MVFMESLHVTLQDTYDIKLIFEPCFWTKFLILHGILIDKLINDKKTFENIYKMDVIIKLKYCLLGVRQHSLTHSLKKNWHIECTL